MKANQEKVANTPPGTINTSKFANLVTLMVSEFHQGSKFHFMWKAVHNLLTGDRQQKAVLVAY